MFCQVDVSTAAGTASSILADRSDAMVILVGLIGLVAFWLWKIHLPQKQSEQKLREADKEIHQANASTLAELSKVTTGIHQTTLSSNSTLKAMIEVKEIELECISDVAAHTQCDVREKISLARGVIRAVRAGATSE